MSRVSSLIGELDRALRSSASEQRIATLRRVTDLFLANASVLDGPQVEVFDNVLGQMIKHIEDRALAELGERLAPIENAPTEIIRTLAMHDRIEVAGPVLKTSTRLSGADLVKIARSRGQAHLLAISDRSSIDEDVTDVLIERGDNAVMRRVAGNEGAKFSAGGYSTLVQRAEQDDDLADTLGARKDISPQLFGQLLEKASQAVKERLLARLDPQAAAAVAQTVSKISSGLAAKNPRRDYSTAQLLAGFMHREGKLKESELLHFACANRFEEVVVSLSLLCQTSVEIVEQLMLGDRIEALLIPMKAAEMSWPTVKAVMQLHPSHRTTSAESYEALRRDFAKLSPATSQRVVRFWNVRSTAAGKGIREGGAQPDIAARVRH